MITIKAVAWPLLLLVMALVGCSDGDDANPQSSDGAVVGSDGAPASVDAAVGSLAEGGVTSRASVVCGDANCSDGQVCYYCRPGQQSAYACGPKGQIPEGCFSPPYNGPISASCDDKQDCAEPLPWCLWTQTARPTVACGKPSACMLSCTCPGGTFNAFACKTIDDCPPCASSCTVFNPLYPVKLCRSTAF